MKIATSSRIIGSEPVVVKPRLFIKSEVVRIAREAINQHVIGAGIRIEHNHAPRPGLVDIDAARGRVVVEDNGLQVERGSGEYLRRERSEAANPSGRLVPELDPSRNFDAKIL